MVMIFLLNGMWNIKAVDLKRKLMKKLRKMDADTNGIKWYVAQIPNASV